MKHLLFAGVLLGGAWLTAARLPAFSSDAALWSSATPSTAPRVYVNGAAALIAQGQFELAAQTGVHAIALADRDASTYERAAVRRLVREQLRLIDAWMPICGRPDYSSHC